MLSSEMVENSSKIGSLVGQRNKNKKNYSKVLDVGCGEKISTMEPDLPFSSRYIRYYRYLRFLRYPRFYFSLIFSYGILFIIFSPPFILALSISLWFSILSDFLYFLLPLFMILILVAPFGGVNYYFKVIKKKRENNPNLFKCSNYFLLVLKTSYWVIEYLLDRIKSSIAYIYYVLKQIFIKLSNFISSNLKKIHLKLIERLGRYKSTKDTVENEYTGFKALYENSSENKTKLISWYNNHGSVLKVLACIVSFIIFIIGFFLFGKEIRIRILLTGGFIFIIYKFLPRFSCNSRYKEKQEKICITSFLVFLIIFGIVIYIINFIEWFIISYLTLIVILKVYLPRNHKNPKTKYLATIVIFSLVIFPVFLSWENLSIKQEICPIPSFSILPQEHRGQVRNLNLIDLEYTENPEDLGEITFNSLISIKLKPSLNTPMIIRFQVMLGCNI